MKCRLNGELSGGRKADLLAVWTLHPASYSKTANALAGDLLSCYMCAGKEVIFLKTNVKTNTKKLVVAALMTALCVVIGLVCKRFLTFGAIRITLENLPILLAGILLGPVYGATVGIAADLISAPLSGFGVNPIITLGAASIGMVAGMFSQYIIKRKGFLQTLLASLSAHAVGSMIIKSLGLWTYGYAWQMLLMRVPLYLLIGTAEAYLIFVILKNKHILSLASQKGEKR